MGQEFFQRLLYRMQLEHVTNNHSTGRRIGIIANRYRQKWNVYLKQSHLYVGGGTSISLAMRYWLSPIGLRNSSNKSSPGVMGSSFFIIGPPELLFPYQNGGSKTQYQAKIKSSQTFSTYWLGPTRTKIPGKARYLYGAPRDTSSARV